MARFIQGLDVAGRCLSVLVPLFMLAGTAMGDVAASTVAALFLLRSALTGDWQWLRERWVQLALLLWVFIALRGAFAADAMLAAGRGAAWVRFPLFGAALQYWALRDEATRRRLFLSASFAALFFTADTLWQYVFHADLFGRPRLDYAGIVRLTGPYKQPHAGMLILFLLFPLLLALRERSFPAALVLGLAAGIAIYLAGERMAVLLYLLGLGVSFLLLPRVRGLVVAIALLGAVGAAALTYKLPVLQHRQIEATQFQFRDGLWGSSYGRIWRSALLMGDAHPFFGVGGKEFTRYCPDPAYGDTTPLGLHLRCPLHPHNNYAQWYAEDGAIGLLLYVAMLGCWIATIAQRSAVWSNEPVLTGLVVTLLMRLWPLTVGSSLYAAWTVVPLWLVAGWLLAALTPASSAAKR